MKILVTGAAGFLGRHLAAEAASRGQVIAVVRVSCDISGAIVVERANLSGRDAVRLLFERWRPNVVLHAPLRAARVVRSTSEDIYTFFDDNVRATVNLYHYSQVVGTRRVMFSSSMSV
jgi:nucleoside-diphosphate-sugar epimerase